jgi:transposase-like protein
VRAIAREMRVSKSLVHKTLQNIPSETLELKDPTA